MGLTVKVTGCCLSVVFLWVFHLSLGFEVQVAVRGLRIEELSFWSSAYGLEAIKLELSGAPQKQDICEQ